ncbi:MAG: hypothetical protein ACXIVL_06440 [Oceanicaulis sp.]
MTRPLTGHPARHTQVREGYVFPLVLAAIIIITIVTTIASTQVRLGNARMADMMSRGGAHLAMHSAEQTFLYLALTSPASAEGLEFGAVRDPSGDVYVPSTDPDRPTLVPANGAPVLFGDGPVILRYLDQQAFINLTGIEPAYIEARFDVLGIDRSIHQTVYAQLGDFQDEDDLTRVGGAEADAYAQPGLPPNRLISSPLEACVPPALAGLDLCADEGRLLLLTEPRESAQLNARLASRFLLDALAGRGEELGRRGWEGEDGIIQSFGAMGWPEFDVHLDIFHLPSPPSNHFVLVTHDPDGVLVRRTAFELTPGHDGRPYVIRSRYRIGGEYVRDALKVLDAETSRRLPEPG